MINQLPPAPRLGREHWDRVHRAGDKHPPITLPEAHHPFWAPEWELQRDHWRQRRPRALVALWIGLVLASLGAWAVILFTLGVFQ